MSASSDRSFEIADTIPVRQNEFENLVSILSNNFSGYVADVSEVSNLFENLDPSDASEVSNLFENLDPSDASEVSNLFDNLEQPQWNPRDFSSVVNLSQRNFDPEQHESVALDDCDYIPPQQQIENQHRIQETSHQQHAQPHQANPKPDATLKYLEELFQPALDFVFESDDSVEEAVAGTAIPAPPEPRKVPGDREKFLEDGELEFLEKFSQIGRYALEEVNRGHQTLRRTKFEFRDIDKMPEELTIELFYGKVFDIFIRMIIGLSQGDLHETTFALRICHVGLHESSGFYKTDLTYQELDSSVLANKIARMCQSNTNLMVDDSFEIQMDIFNPPRDLIDDCGEGMKDLGQVFKKRVLGTNMCLPKAFAIGLLDAELRSMEPVETKKKLKNKLDALLRKKRSGERLQESAAKEVMAKAGIDMSKALYDRGDLVKLAEAYPDHQLVVWSRDQHQKMFLKVFHENVTSTKIVSLVLHNLHYDHCFPSRSTLNMSYCVPCNLFYHDKNHYDKCDGRCQDCGFADCDRRLADTTKCDTCGVTFRSKLCFDQHMLIDGRMKKPKCETRSCCSKCSKIYKHSDYNVGETHQCGRDIHRLRRKSSKNPVHRHRNHPYQSSKK